MGSLVLVMVIMAMYWWRKDAKERAKELERIRDAQQVQLALAEVQGQFSVLCRAVETGESSMALHIVENAKCTKCGCYSARTVLNGNGRIVCIPCKGGTISL